MRKKIWAAALLLLGTLWLLAGCGGGDQEALAAYREKAEALRQEALADWVRLELGTAPAGEAGHAVFLSVCDARTRASVFTGTGGTPDEAWEAASGKAEQAVLHGLAPVWVKADVVYLSQTVTGEELGRALKGSAQGFFRYGAALDGKFETALLEAEANGAGIYDYEAGRVDRDRLNGYLKKAGRRTVSALPERYTVFQCAGWLCGEDGQVWELGSSGLGYGGRKVEALDGDCAAGLVRDAGAFLAGQVKEDGSFVYELRPQTGEESGSYNLLRHAGSVWSMICAWRLENSQPLEEAIRRSVDYLLERVVYDPAGRAFLYEEQSGEIKLGGCGLAVIALTEYMDAFGDESCREVCGKLGEGILSLLDQETGVYYHVLNRDFSRKEESRTVFYDGEATFALCRLYGLTGDGRWLEAAESAAEHFIEADYTQHKDHWVAYAMNELTKYVTDNPRYFAFALQNVQANLEAIRSSKTSYPTYLELLMATFQLYDRMLESGAAVEGFDQTAFLDTIRLRAEQMRYGYFYPEYAMYMENPGTVLHAFMTRNDGFRVRIDDTQHSIGGYYLYCLEYERLVERGMER